MKVKKPEKNSNFMGPTILLAMQSKTRSDQEVNHVKLRTIKSMEPKGYSIGPGNGG
jgi:hypothetical protein